MEIQMAENRKRGRDGNLIVTAEPSTVGSTNAKYGKGILFLLLVY